jgi:hypothetical protein
MDSEPAGVQFYFRAPPSPEAVQCRWTFPTTLPRGMCPLNKVAAPAEMKRVRGIAVLSEAGWYQATLRTEQLNDPNIGPILQVVETVERPERKEIADCGPRSNATRLSGNRSL